MMARKFGSLALTLVLLFCLFTPTVYAADTGTQPYGEVQTEEAPRPQDDYYEAVNNPWMEATEIPAYGVSQGVMQQAGDAINWQLMQDYAAMIASGEPTDDPRMDEFLKYYQLATDYGQRDSDGAAPLLEVFDRIDAIQTLEDLNDNIVDFMLDGIDVPLMFDIRAVMGVNYLITQMPSLYLDSKAEYEIEQINGYDTMRERRITATMMLELAGFETAEAEAMVAYGFEFDKALVPMTLTPEQITEKTAEGTYLLEETIEEFALRSENLDLYGIIEALCGGEAPEGVLVFHTEYFDILDSVIQESTLPMIKDWMKVNFLLKNANYLSDEMRVTNRRDFNLIYNLSEVPPADIAAFNLVDSEDTFQEWNGYYYGKTYFTEWQRETAYEMLETLRGVYWERLMANDWLGEETKEKAIQKLLAMRSNIGYDPDPAERYSYYDITPASEGGTLLGNTMAMRNINNRLKFATVFQPADEAAPWTTPAHVMNATYMPASNAITIPASLFHPLLVNPEASKSWNYGMVGTIIGHEISHAFDNTGSLFDENGNMNNWWTDEDRAAFEERSQQLVDLFDGIPYGNGVVNGNLTLGENIADLGGIASVVQAVQNMEDGNLDHAFGGFATIFCMKIAPQRVDELLLIDSHAPTKLRVNVQYGNLDVFNEYYGITETDGMYIPPESRVTIW